MSVIPEWEFRLTTTPTLTVALVDDAKTLIDCFHRDIISFLSIAQYHKVDFLPITWDDNQHALGRGATGEINQSIVNIQTSFAFKRFKNQDNALMFKELISEVVLLSQLSIKTHPNIVDLQGISFEVDHDTEEVRPTLVFKKAEFGSLRMFMDSGGGNDIGFGKKLKICSEIGSALMTMHNLDVIHGDIKPENILVFGDTVDEVTARVTDFGYSCMGAEDKDLVYLPVTWDWCAPEYHDRGIELHRAKKMDIYSYGMVCLWVLFGEDFTKLRDDLKKTKDRGQFQRSAMDLALKAEYFGDELCAFFDLALREDWQARGANLEKLVMLLGQDMWKPGPDRQITLSDYNIGPEDARDPERFQLVMERIHSSNYSTGAMDRRFQAHLDSGGFGICQHKWESSLLRFEDIIKHPVRSSEQSVENRISLTHDCFNISRVIHQLNYLDYRVRAHITESLVRRATDNACEQCSTETIFQIAFCYSIGFGVPSDHKIAQRWLERSTEESVVLEEHLNYLRRIKPTDIAYGTFMELSYQGLFEISQTNRYRNDEQLRRAEAHYEREIRDLESCLGQGHILTLEMRRALLHIKEALGKIEEAEEIGWQLKHDSEKGLGPGHPFTLLSDLYLAEKLRIQKRWEEAEKLALEAKQLGLKILEPKNPVILLALHNLHLIYIGLGKDDEAERSSAEFVRSKESAYGPDPMLELAEISNSGWRYMNEGNLQAAEDLLSHAQQEFERILGPSDTSTMMTTRNLALTYRKQGRILESEKMQIILKETIENALGPEARETLEVMYDLARTYHIQERWGEAIDMQVKVKEGRGRILGQYHPKTIDCINALAQIYMDQERLKEAEGAFLQVKKARERMLGLYHTQTIDSIYGLARVYMKQRRLEEAEEAFVQVKKARENTLGRSDLLTLEASRALGVVYLWQAKLEQAEESMAELRTISEDVLGPVHIETLGTMSNIGQVYLYQRRFKEAEEILLKTKEAMEVVVGPEHPYTKGTTKALVRVYLDQMELERDCVAPLTTTQEQDLSTDDAEDEEELLNAAIAMSLDQPESEPDIPETDEDEIIRNAIELSLQNDDS